MSDEQPFTPPDLPDISRPPPHSEQKLQQCRDRDQDDKRSEVVHLGYMPKPITQAKSTLTRLKDSILEKDDEDKFGIEIQHLHHQIEAATQLLRELIESKQTGHSSDHSKQKLGAHFLPISNPLKDTGAHGITQLSLISKAESAQTTGEDQSEDLYQSYHLPEEVLVVTTKSQDNICGKSEVVKSHISILPSSSDDSGDECGKVSVPPTIPEVGLVTPVLTEGSKSTQLTSTQYEPAMTPCIHNLQGNITQKSICTQQPTPAIDSARSANLGPNPKFHLQSRDKWIVLYIMSKPLQFGVAVKYLSQPIWVALQDEENTLYFNDKATVARFSWQKKLAYSYCQNREENTTAFPSPFSLKQQPSLIELLSSEEQLHPPARLALLSATAKNASNQQMLLRALPPSNSTKSHFPQPQELPTHSQTLGSGSDRNNQIPALRGYEFKPRYPPWVTLDFKHRYCALTLQVMQETDGGHVKWLLSYVLTLHTPSHGTCSHSFWPLQRVSVGKNCNSHTFEWSFVLEIHTKDQFTLSNTIHDHPRSADTLPTVGVVIPQPVSGRFPYSNTAIASCVYTNSFALEIVPTQCKLLLTANSLTICTLPSPMGMIEHDIINSFYNLSFCVSYPCYSTTSASIPSLKCSVAHSQPQSGIDSSEATFTKDFISESSQDAPSDYASKRYLQSKQESTVLSHPRSMTSFLPRSFPLDLTTEVQTVSSPHSSDQKDSKKDGSGGGQGSSSIGSSSPGRSDGGGGANSNAPSNSGSGGRGDDGNKRNRKQDGEKEESNHQQEKKEVQEGMPSACKEDEWQLKQHTSHHLPSVHLAEGWFLQKPEHEGRVDKGLDYHGTDTRCEDEEQNVSESTYGKDTAIEEEQSTLHAQNPSESLRFDECMQQPTSAIDSARSAIHSNLTLDLEFDLQLQDKWMVLCTKSLQFGVAVKNLSQNYLHSSDKSVVSNSFWQKMSVSCQNREEEISIASPSPFSLKQQPSLIELLNSEEQLHPPARLALVSATAKNISNQQMLLLALPPSNSTKLHFPQPQELPTHSHTLGSGSVRNNQTPALRGYEFKPRYCPWVTLHFKHRYCALTLQVTWMIQETDGGHVKLLLSYMLTLHTPSHGTCSHSPWPLQRVLVGKSFNSHTFEWSFMLEIPTKDQFALSIAIHPLSADTHPTVGVDIPQPVSGQFQYSNTAIASCVYRNSFALDIVPTQCKLLLTVHSQTFCTLCLSMGTIEHDNINSFHNLSFRVSRPCYSTASASIPNLKCSVAHSPSQSGSKASFTEDLIPENPEDAPSDYASKSYLQSKQKSTIFPPQMSMRSFLPKHSPLDLTTGVQTVSSPHSSDQKDSKKDGNGGGQESSGNCSSSPGRSDGGGGANSNPPSNSGSGGRGDDDNKRNRKQDGEKEESDHQQEKKEVAEVQEGMPSACKEDEWQSKQHTSHHQPSVHLAEGWFLQKPEHEGKVDKGLENHGTDTQREDEEQNVPESTYGKDTAIEEEQSTLHAQNPSESLRFDECMQHPTSAIDSARSAIHSNLTLDLEFDLQSQDKWMVLCTKSLQFEVAVKNLSQNSLHSSDKPVVSNFFWQMSAFCQNREEEISIASPSPFSLKQQPSLIELLNSEEQLHPPARLALVSVAAKNISNQRMLLLALPPSNSTKLHFPQPQELPTHSHTLGSGSDRNNQTPALRGYEFKPRYCPWVTLHFKHRYCALTLQVTWMIQETDGGHVKLLLSYMLTLHTPSHGTCSHSPWPLQRVSVGKSFNSHTFEWSFVLEIPTKDQFALSIAIHPLSADTLPTVGVDIPQPVSGQFQYSNTAIASCVHTNSFALDIVPTQCKLLLTVHSQTFCTLRLPTGTIKHDNINSFHNLSFRVSHPCYSTASASIPNLKCSVAHSPQSGSKASFTENFIPENPEDAHSDYASKSYIQSKQKSTIFPPQMSMRSFLPKHSPLDLTTGVQTVSSPHSSDQKDPKKDGNGGGQESSGNCSSSPGRSDGGGGANSNPPSNSGSGGRGDDDDNKRNRKQDAEKEDSDLQQEKKEVAEVQEGMPSACKEDEWQSKQHTSHHQPSVHLAEGWFLQKPEHEGKMDKGLDYHGTDTRHEVEEQNGPESTYGTKAAIEEEQSTLHEVQNSSKSLRLDKCMKGLSTSTVATEPLLSSTGHDYSIEQQEDDHSPSTTPNTEESVDDSVPNTKEHTTEHSPVLKGGSQDGYSEETRPSTVTQVSKHDSNQNPTLAESQSASCEAQAVDQLGSNKVSQSKNEGEINMVMMNTNVMPATCQLPLMTTAEDGLPAPIKIFQYDYGNEIEENKVDGSQNLMPDFQHHLHGSVTPVQSEDTAHNARPGATAHVRPQMTSFSSVLVCQLVSHVSHDNPHEPVVTIPTKETPVLVSKQHTYINVHVHVCMCIVLICPSYFLTDRQHSNKFYCKMGSGLSMDVKLFVVRTLLTLTTLILYSIFLCVPYFITPLLPSSFPFFLPS